MRLRTTRFRLSSQDGIDKARQILDRKVARIVSVCPLEKGFEVSGGAKKSHKLLLIEDAIRVCVGLHMPLSGSFAGDPIPLDALELRCEFLQVEGA